MQGALVIFIAMVVIGVILYVTDVLYFRKKYPQVVEPPKPEESAEGHGEGCCGTHLICEKTSLSPLSTEIIYYDDEELDRFKGKAAESYTPEETEEFRDILLTLMPSDVAGWARSLQLREINLPGEVRDELLMIVSEYRNALAEVIN